MKGNKQAYDEAYLRALGGHSPNLWQRVTALFEDEYTRQSRMKGVQDGAEARAAQAQAPVVETAAATPSVEA
jgi:hypothetical protein